MIAGHGECWLCDGIEANHTRTGVPVLCLFCCDLVQSLLQNLLPDFDILRHQIHSECEQKVTGELSVVVRVRSEWEKLKLSRSRFRPPPDDSHHHHHYCCAHQRQQRHHKTTTTSCGQFGETLFFAQSVSSCCRTKRHYAIRQSRRVREPLFWSGPESA